MNSFGMETGINPGDINLLSERPLPEVNQVQLERFTPESIQAKPQGTLDIVLPEGGRSVGIDIGGDSLSARIFEVQDGQLTSIETLVDFVGARQGAGYLPVLETVSNVARLHNLPVGISYCGLVEDTKPLSGDNVPHLVSDLQENYGGDFGNLFPTIKALKNDAIAGLYAGALHVERTLPASNIIYLITGSGLNTAVLINGLVYSNESGHVPVEAALNPYGQDDKCKMSGYQYVCVESVAASKAGVESIYHKKTKEALDGIRISEKMQAGDPFALDLYDNSTNVNAHVVQGVARAMGISLTEGDTAIVGHGGIFKVPGYSDRLAQVLTAQTGANPPIHLTKDFSENACLEGAAIAAMG